MKVRARLGGPPLKVFLAGRVAIEHTGVVIDEGRFPGRQGRLLFAYLVAEQSRPVPRDELADVLWGETPPATWDKALTVLVSKLRALLANGTDGGRSILTAAFGCYRLELPEGSWVDITAAAKAAQEAEKALAAGNVDGAKTAATVAASLLQAPFLPGEDAAWVEQKRRDLADVRGEALSILADACLRSGNAPEAAKWAEQTIVLTPFRETGYRRLMEAHVAAGNRAEALQAYERCRRLLADELGAYPSPETESIYRELLETPSAGDEAESVVAAHPQDESEPEPAPARQSRSRRGLAAAGLAVVVAAAAVTGILAATRGQAHATVAANSVVALEPSGSIAGVVPVGTRPVAVTSRAGALWVANLDDQSVTRVNASSRRAVRSVPLGGAPTGLTATSSGVWATEGYGDVTKVDPRYDRVTLQRHLSARPSGQVPPGSSLLAAFESIWVVDPDGYVLRVDPASGRSTGSVDVGNDPSAIGAGFDSLWVANRADGTVTRIDPATLVTTTIPVGHGPVSVTVNAAGVWVANADDDRVVRIDPGTNAVASATRVGDEPTAVLATRAALWVANGGDGTVMRLDPRSGKVDKRIHLGGTPDALGSAAGHVWVAVAPAPPPTAARGGVARITTQYDLAPLDPAVSIDPYLFYATCANLVTYPDAPAPEGSHIVPEVADAVPVPTNGGTTYTFRIRSGFRFSPPSNEPVTASTFKSTIERVTDPRTKSRLAMPFSGIVGYRAYVTGKARTISGVVARGRTLTIRLTRPDGAFLANLATGIACAVPRDTPVDPNGLNDISSAGPYYVASYTPRQQIVLRRNPNYHGGRPNHLDEIVFTIGIGRQRALEEIEAGKADYALELPRDAGPKLESRYGPGSKAARAGHQRYFVTAALGERYLHMNTSRPLFGNVRLRRAVAYALDRSALVAQGRRYAEVNPFNAGEATDDYVPPSDAAPDFHLYPLNGPDLRRAKRLAGRVHATAIMYTPNLPPWVQEAQVVRRNLAPLGIDVEVKEFPIADFFRRIARPGEPFDLAVSGWAFASPDPLGALEEFRIVEPSGAPNVSHFHDPAFDRQLKAAAKLSGAKRYRASNRLELELERDLVPAVPFATTASRDFFSARIGCETYQPVYGMDLAALCLRRADAAG